MPQAGMQDARNMRQYSAGDRLMAERLVATDTSTKFGALGGTCHLAGGSIEGNAEVARPCFVHASSMLPVSSDRGSMPEARTRLGTTSNPRCRHFSAWLGPSTTGCSRVPYENPQIQAGFASRGLRRERSKRTGGPRLAAIRLTGDLTCSAAVGPDRYRLPSYGALRRTKTCSSVRPVTWSALQSGVAIPRPRRALPRATPYPSRPQSQPKKANASQARAGM